MKLNTVNVIEVVDNNVTEVFSYTDNKKGNKEAEAMFAKLGKENGMKDGDLEASIENGYWNDEDEPANFYNVFITHSS